MLQPFVEDLIKLILHGRYIHTHILNICHSYVYNGSLAQCETRYIYFVKFCLFFTF